MAVRHGYGKIAGADALVFAYDTGDTRNSFKGKPATNLLTTISKGNTNQALFKILPGTEVKNVPGMGTRTVEYVDVYNDYNGGSGNCCPSPMHFGDFSVSPSTVYTYQIVYKTATGYAHPNYMYHYEYNGGTYVTEYGLWNSGRIQDLGDGWKHAWGTFTSNASTNRFICYLFHYEYGIENRIEVAGVMLTQGSSIIPPSQFLSVNTTRSSTQGLLDLTGNSTIDLANVSFDANAQMFFDGTDDRIILPPGSLPTIGTNDFTLEFVCKNTRTNSYNHFFSVLDQYHISFKSYNVNGLLYVYRTSALSTTNSIPAYIPSRNDYYHIVAKRQGDNMQIYINGESQGVKTGWGDVSIDNNLYNSYIGWGAGTEYSGGHYAIAKIYNRALTAAEVRNNYNQYKGRFNL